jgi:hypothetical protein
MNKEYRQLAILKINKILNISNSTSQFIPS